MVLFMDDHGGRIPDVMNTEHRRIVLKRQKQVFRERWDDDPGRGGEITGVQAILPNAHRAARQDGYMRETVRVLGNHRPGPLDRHRLAEHAVSGMKLRRDRLFGGGADDRGDACSAIAMSAVFVNGHPALIA